MDAQALFAELCARLHVWPDQQGEVYIDCPNPTCGRGNKHFSFALLTDGGLHIGGHCHACGYKIGARGLMALVGLAPDYPLPPAPRVMPKPKDQGPRGILDPHAAVSADGWATRWADHPESVARWQAYCPPLTPQAIEDAMLGYGTFPASTSRCDRPRLMVPLFAGEKVVGFRGRLVGPDCGKCKKPDGSSNCARWLSALGTKAVLYGAETIQAGKPLVVVESPVEALLLRQMGKISVATCGVSVWKPEWTVLVKRCSRIMVLYDNDPAGNGGTMEARETWFAEHPKTPKNFFAGGARLANILLRDGCKNVRLYHWPRGSKAGMDVRDAVMEKDLTV